MDTALQGAAVNRARGPSDRRAGTVCAVSAACASSGAPSLPSKTIITGPQFSEPTAGRQFIHAPVARDRDPMRPCQPCRPTVFVISFGGLEPFPWPQASDWVSLCVRSATSVYPLALSLLIQPLNNIVCSSATSVPTKIRRGLPVRPITAVRQPPAGLGSPDLHFLRCPLPAPDGPCVLTRPLGEDGINNNNNGNDTDDRRGFTT